MKSVQKSAWKVKEMSNETRLIPINMRITEEEFHCLKLGVKPKDMDDRWFIYFENNQLYFHRSWTGSCIFIASITEKSPDDILITDVRITQNKQEFNVPEKKQKGLFLNLLYSMFTL
ncbi:hypothetical protein [Isobaculum melis]|nr:hypothetical protein [Isobaculum melis]